MRYLGGGNFVVSFCRTTRNGGGSMSRFVSIDHEYTLMYIKNLNKICSRFFIPYEDEYIKRYKEEDEIGKYFWDTFVRNRQGSSNIYEIEFPDGKKITNSWIYKESEFKKLLQNGDIRFLQKSNGEYSVQIKQRINKDGMIARSELRNFVNALGTKTITDLLGKEIFTYAKPYELIMHFLKLITNTEQTKDLCSDIILDFFSGSATTAHAVMQLNAEDGGNRKYIMVQLPEKTPEDSEARKAGYSTICEIGKERIRRAGEKIKKDYPNANIDTGFRVFKLDSSNMEDVYYEAEKLSQQDINKQISNIKDDRSEEDLLFQIILSNAIPLTCKIEIKKINNKKVYFVNDTYLFVCFEKDIDEKTIEELAKLKPEIMVFNQDTQDSTLANIEQIFKMISSDTNIKVI